MHMRVAIDARVEYGRAGGVQQGIGVLSRALGAAHAQEVAYTFLTLEGLDAWLRTSLPAGATTSPVAPGRAHAVRTVLRTSTLGRRALSTGVALQRRRGPSGSTGTFESLGADVVHFPTQRAELTTVPFVYQPWDLQHRHLAELFPASERRRRDEHYGTYCRRAAVVVVPTEHVRGDVLTAYDVDPERVVVIAPWAPAATPAGGSPGASPTQIDHAEQHVGDPYVLFPAQVWPHKNHRRLIDAVALLRDGGLRIRVVCPGATGDGAAVLRRYAARRGLESQFDFPGYVDDATMARLYRGARALVFPSLFEGWGYPVVEAMELGIPVTCSAGPHLDDAAGDAAVRFDPLNIASIADGLRAVCTDEARRSTLLARGAAHVATFDWAAMGRAYAAVHRAAAEHRVAADASGRLLRV